MERRVALSSLLLTLVSLLSVASDARCEAEMSVSIERPLVVALDRLSPAQQELLEDLLDKARREPMDGFRRGQLGMAYETNGYPRAALTSYCQAEELDGQEPKWPYYQAFLLAGRGELQRALDALDRSLRLDSRNRCIHIFRDHITPVHETASHILPVAWVALHIHRRGLKH